MAGGGVLGKLKALDAYPKINEDFFTKTFSGGIITLVASIVMALLFLSELRMFLVTSTVHELSVDITRGEKIAINFDVTFPHMPCSWLSLDAMDISGDLHLDVDHDVYKQRLSSSGAPLKQAERHDIHQTKAKGAVGANGTSTAAALPACGTCYGAEDKPGDCCNTCDEVRSAYRRKGWALSNVDHIEQCLHDAYTESIKEQVGEGCRMWGMLEVNKVAGNFHFAPGRSYQQGSMHVHDIAPFGEAVMDFSHAIATLSFGRTYPGMKNPLDHVKVAAAVPAPKQLAAGQQGHPGAADNKQSGMYQYFLKVVPTEYTDVRNATLATNQYSVTENYREGGGGGAAKTLPGVFFFYDLSPIKVKIVESKSSFLSFLTSVCAIVGGVFTVSGIVDAFVYQGEKLIRKKMELGKFS